MKANVILKRSRRTEKHVEQYNPGVTSLILNTAKSLLDVCNWKKSRRQRNQRTIGSEANPGKNKSNRRRWNWLHCKARWFKSSALNSPDLTGGTTNKRDEKNWMGNIWVNAVWIQSEIRRPKVAVSLKRALLQTCHLRGHPIVISEWLTQDSFHRMGTYLTETIPSEMQWK